MSIKLPTYEESEAASDDLTATSLQRFIYNYEPGDNDNEWRKHLTEALNDTRADLARKVLETVKGEQLHEHLDNESDAGYRNAINDVHVALRELFQREGVNVD